MSEDETGVPDSDIPDTTQSDIPSPAPVGDIDLQEMAAPGKDIPQPVSEKSASDLEAVFDVPVRVSVILGRAKIPISNLLKMDVGTVVELDRQVGEAIEVYVNDRLIARGEIVLVENKLGITMTEIIKAA